MYYRIFFNIVFVVLIAVLQISFISNLPFWLDKLNIVLICSIFILGLAGFKASLWFLIGCGFIFDSYSFGPFGIFLLAFLITIVFSNFLLTNFLTNRSPYSYSALIAFSIIIYELLILFLSYFFNLFDSQVIQYLFREKYWSNLFKMEIVNIILALIVFYLFNFIDIRLRPVFLIKSKGNN